MCTNNKVQSPFSTIIYVSNIIDSDVESEGDDLSDVCGVDCQLVLTTTQVNPSKASYGGAV